MKFIPSRSVVRFVYLRDRSLFIAWGVEDFRGNHLIFVGENGESALVPISYWKG